MVEFEINGVKLQIDTGDVAFLELLLAQLDVIQKQLITPNKDGNGLEYMKHCNETVHNVIKNLYGEDVLDSVIVNKNSITESMRVIRTIATKFKESERAVETEMLSLAGEIVEVLKHEQVEVTGLVNDIMDTLQHVQTV